MYDVLGRPCSPVIHLAIDSFGLEIWMSYKTMKGDGINQIKNTNSSNHHIIYKVDKVLFFYTLLICKAKSNLFHIPPNQIPILVTFFVLCTRMHFFNLLSTNSCHV